MSENFFSGEAGRSLQSDEYTGWPFPSSIPQQPFDIPATAPPDVTTGSYPYPIYPPPLYQQSAFPPFPPDQQMPIGPVPFPPYPGQPPIYGSSVIDSADPGDPTNYGTQNPNGTWSCAYPGCSSRVSFTRACDLRKHFNRHKKSLFCRFENCPQANEGGFSSKKDRDRHEASHNPQIQCEWEGCGRIFSRVDNMKDHVRRIHKKR
jgi:hypothetical protein